jgi:hypothetical protein
MKLMVAAAMIATAVAGLQAQEIDYPALWAKATPFHELLEGVRARREHWRSRFANAAIEPEALDAARALPGKRRILAIAEDRCSDSAWAVPYLAKLAAAVPDKLELRVISAASGRQIQAQHLTPDGRQATPTIVVLDENSRFIGAWVERPAELQKWYIESKPSMDRDELYERVTAWYEKDAGKSTVSEVLTIMRREPVEKH